MVGFAGRLKWIDRIAGCRWLAREPAKAEHYAM